MKHKNAYYWYCQFGGWGMFILLYTFFYFTQHNDPEELPYYFHSMFFEAGTGMAITHFMRYLIRESKLMTLSLQKQIFWILIVTISFALIYNSLVVVVEQTNDWEPTYYEGISFTQKWFRTLMGSLLYFIIWSLLYFAYHYVSGTQSQRLNQVRLETMVKELELKTIKAHINPHFIFNALNSIRALVDEDPQRARNAITELSHLLRSSMNADKEELVPLNRELSIVKNYLALEQIRFEDRLKVQLNIDPATLNLPVPPMMLQTLVENAIKHGISKEVLGGHIDIVSTFNNGSHILSITNTGRLNGESNPEGFGLSSTRNRLSLLYGNGASFEIKENPQNEVEAKVIIPTKTN